MDGGKEGREVRGAFLGLVLWVGFEWLVDCWRLSSLRYFIVFKLVQLVDSLHPALPIVFTAHSFT